jgi:hypothetical protein
MIYLGTTVDSMTIKPQISKRKAFVIVENYLSERIDGFGGVTQWCCFEDNASEERVGYMLEDEFLAKGYDCHCGIGIKTLRYLQCK